MYLEFMPCTFTNYYQACVVIIMILHSLAIKIVTKIDKSAAFKKKKLQPISQSSGYCARPSLQTDLTLNSLCPVQIPE